MSAATPDRDDLRAENDELRARAATLERQVAELRHTEEELRAREERYRALFENSLDAILIADEQGTYVQANDAACRLLGRPREQVMGMNVSELISLDQAAPRERYERFVERGSETGEITLRRPDGQIRVADYVACRIAPGLYQSILRDVTSRRQAEAQLHEQLQAVAALRERERLARDLHSSLAQVLSYIGTQAQAVRDFITGGRPTMAAASLMSLITVVHEMQKDVQAYILGTRAEQILADFAMPAADVSSAIREQVRWIEELYGLHVELDDAAAPGPDEVSPMARLQLTRIVQEALINVCKHAGVAEAKVSLRRAGDRLHVAVCDAGRGVPATAGRPEGYGIQSMRSRAHEIGGALEITSAPGAGTCVLVEAPIGAAAHRTAGGVRVLLVDDSQLFVQGLRQLLEARGFTVVGVAHDGLDGLRLARELHPDVVTLDVEMSKLGGFEVLDAIRAELPGVQVVMLTVAEDETTILEALRRGASGYLPKRLDPASLCDQLVGLVRGETALPPALATRILRELATRAGEAPEELLSDQQIKVLTLLARGLTYKEIGRVLGYSERAIKYHTGDAIKILGLRDRAAATAYARRQLGRGAWPAMPEEGWPSARS